MVEKKKIVEKKFIPTIIAVVILIILAIAVFWDKPKTTPPAEEGIRQLFQFNNADVNYISIETTSNPEINCDIKLAGDEKWYVNGRLAYTPEIMRILDVLKSVKVISEIKDYPSLSDFGLNPPKKILVIGFKEGTNQDISVLIGDYAPASKHRYIKLPEIPDVYMVNKYVYSAISVTPSGLLDKDAFGLEPDKVEKIIITRQNSKFALTKKDDGWYVTLPSKLNVLADQEYVKSILNAVLGNNCQAVIADMDTNVERYGLKIPAITIKAVDDSGKESEVIVSNVIPSTDLNYLMNVETNKVFIMSSSKIERLIFNDLEIRNKKIIVPSIDNINRIVLTKDGKKYEFIKDKSKIWISKNLKLETLLATEYIEKLFTRYVDITSDMKIKETDEDFGFDDSILKIEAFEKNKAKEKSYQPYTVKIGKNNKEGNYFMQKSGDPYLYLIKQDTFDFMANPDKHFGG